jgi:tRNA(Leu) C34 or U34 (ribose-2'-O)-methylase TrmL
MKHVKLFESFVNEAKMSKVVDLLTDVLANLEDAFTEEEFIEFGVEDLDLPAETMKDMFNAYWDLDARLRLKWTINDWAKWLDKNYSIK